MKARDYFAGIAMNYFMEQFPEWTYQKITEYSYEMADAMVISSKKNDDAKEETKNKKVNKARQRWFCYICGGGDEYDGFVYCKKCSQTMPFHPIDGNGCALYKSENYNKTPKP